MKWEDTKETSTFEVKSLRGLRHSLTFTPSFQMNNLKARCVRSAELRLTVLKLDYLGDFAQIISLSTKLKLRK